MGGIAYVPKAEEDAHRKIIGRLFDWFSQQHPEPFEIAVRRLEPFKPFFMGERKCEKP